MIILYIILIFGAGVPGASEGLVWRTGRGAKPRVETDTTNLEGMVKCKLHKICLIMKINFQFRKNIEFWYLMQSLQTFMHVTKEKLEGKWFWTPLENFAQKLLTLPKFGQSC